MRTKLIQNLAASAQRKAGRAGAAVKQARFSIGADHQHTARDHLEKATELIHDLYGELGTLRGELAGDVDEPSASDA